MNRKRHAAFAKVAFLPGMTMQEYLDKCQAYHPALYDRLDLDRLAPDTLMRIYDGLGTISSPFEDKNKCGRGDAYRTTQLKYPLMRARGISRLFDLVTPRDTHLGPDTYILDAMGGNGTLTRAMRLLNAPDATPAIFTGDIAATMVADSLIRGLPAIRQSVERWLLGDTTIDGVIFAYGTHHIPPDERQQAVAEAYRVLRPGGRIVFQDFEKGTPTERWYSEAVDRYTYTGHKHAHFTREEMRQLLVETGFRRVRTHYVYDPCIFSDITPEAARIGVLNYLVSLFALEKLLPDDGRLNAEFWRMTEAIVRPYATFGAEECTRYGMTVGELVVRPNGQRYEAELPRVALVAIGER